MNKKVLFSVVIFGFSISQSNAANLHTGFSIGANIGYTSVDGSLKRDFNQIAFPGGGDSNNSIGKSAPLVGLFLGYGWSPNPVGIYIGGELFGQIQNLNLKREDNYGPALQEYTLKFRTTNTIGAVAKLGYLCKEALFYLKFGVASAKWKSSFEDARPVAAGGFPAATNNNRKTGVVAGVGIDYAIARNWALGAEYTYTGYGSVKLISDLGTFTFRPKVNTFNIRLKYTI